MSATDMPGLTSAKAITASASPSRSRASSVEKLSQTIGATGAVGLGEARRLRLGAAGGESSSETRQTTAARAHLIDILDLDRFAGHPLRQGRGHEAVEIAVEHVGGAVDVTPVRKSLTSW